MALTFNGTTSKLVGANLATGYPISMFAWVRHNSLTTSQMVMGCGDNGGASCLAMQGAGTVAGDPMRAFTRDAGATSQTAASSESMATGVWKPCLVVFRSATSRSVYFGDGAMVTNNTSNTADFAAFDRTVIGCYPLSDTLNANMDIAHAAIWSYSLEDDDWINLKYGVTPSSVQPQALLDYWSLETQAATQTGSKGTVLTATDTSQAGTSPTMGQTIPDTVPVRDSGVWCWFADPRAVHYNGATYFCWVAVNGSIGITKFVHATKARSYFNLAPNFEVDDHDNPGLYIRPDGRIVVMYSLHADATGIRYRISTNAEDITAWGTEQVIAAPGTDVTYANPRYLSGNDRLYVHFRGQTGVGDDRPHWLAYSDDDGATWSTPAQMFAQAGHRPYVKSISNKTNRIDFYLTQGHPGELVSNLYHCIAKLDAGVLKFYKSDGTTELTLPISVNASLDKIYDSGGTVSGWQYDAKYDTNGYPRVLFTRIVSDTDLRYMFTRWNGSAWTTPVEITGAGAKIATGTNYAGGICFSADSADKVILSREASGVADLEEWSTTDSGATWSKVRDITTGSTGGIKNARPIVPDNAAGGMKLLWWKGTYTTWTSYNTDIYFEAGGISGGLAVTESGSDTASIAGDVLISGSLAATESGSDTAAITGAGQSGVTGSLAATESGADTAAMAGLVLVQGTLAATESGSDTAAFTGDASDAIVGSLSAVESGSDTAAATGVVLVSGAIAITETGADVAIVVGNVLVAGSFGLTESGLDAASFSGSAAGAITGTLSAAEVGSDTAAFLRQIFSADRTLSIGAESRVLTVAAENRIHTV